MGRRLAVILAADVVDYTAMMEADSDAAIALIRELRETSLEPVVRAHGGEVLKRMGDGWIIAFASAGAAVECAVAAQTGLAGHPRLRLRMGLHLGEIVEDEADFYGAGVNLAARLQTEAPPGGVMISADLHRQLSGDQAAAFADAGTFRLKNIARPVAGFQWRPAGVAAGPRAEILPSIDVVAIGATPDEPVVRDAAADLRDQIVHSLARRTGVRVRAGADDSDGGATYALRGRLRSAGGTFRATLSLVLSQNGETSWSERYDGEGGDLFAFCDAVASKVDADLRLFINSLDNVRIADLRDEQLSVSELRTRGAGLFYQTSVPSLLRARSVMARACRLNPDDAMALAMWAEAEREVCAVRFERMPDALAETVAAALDRAVELAPGSDFVFVARSQFRSDVARDAAGAHSDATRSLSINPNYALAHSARGAAFSLEGDYARAVPEFRASTPRHAADPMWPHRGCCVAVAQHLDGDPDAAAATLRDLIDLRPSVRAYRKLLAEVLRAAGDAEAAAREEGRARKLSGEPTYHVHVLPLPEADAGILKLLAPDAAP